MRKLHKYVRFNIKNNVEISPTMGKSQRNSKSNDPQKDGNAKEKKVHKIIGIKPFLYEAECWETNAPTQVLKTTENGNKLDNKMFVLHGNEIPEQLML